MKKILIALPLVLIMLLSMVPVMAAEQNATVNVTFFKNKNMKPADEITKETFNPKVDTDLTKAEREAAVEAMVNGRAFPAVDGKAGDQFEWVVMVEETQAFEAKGTKHMDEDDQTAAAPKTFLDLKTDAQTLGITVAVVGTFADADNVNQKAYDELKNAVDSGAESITLNETDHKGSEDVKAYTITVTQADVLPVYTVKAYALRPLATEAPTTEAPTTEAPTTEAPTTEAPTTEAPTTAEPTEAPTTEKLTCPEACEFITVELRDIHSGRNLAWASKQFKVNNKVAPDFDAILDLYLDQYFPWGNWQPVKNYLNVYSIITPKDIFDCKIVIEVIPKWENIMVIHELWDCCITPDGKVKEELRRSFIEDNKRYETWDPNFIDPATGRTVLSGNSSYGLDGLLPIDFLDFHTDLKVNQEKAAEYAKTRLEKMNAADFVFQHATFYENVRVSNYFTGDVYDLDGNLITTWTDGIPTIVIKYLRAECIKTDEKVDDAKVVAGQAGTTSTPVQQLPATGAKDVTAFFMSAVALLGLGIFFAKKR